jgi:hypothetical protein
MSFNAIFLGNFVAVGKVVSNIQYGNEENKHKALYNQSILICDGGICTCKSISVQFFENYQWMKGITVIMLIVIHMWTCVSYPALNIMQ